MEKASQLSIEELLAGTSFLEFLQELAAIRDEEIVDLLPPIEEGDIVIGEMTPLERRVSVWAYRRFGASTQDMRAFNNNTADGIEFLHRLVEARFPDVETYAFRAGFVVVSAKESEPQPSECSVGVISAGSFEELSEILSLIRSHGRTQ